MRNQNFLRLLVICSALGGSFVIFGSGCSFVPEPEISKSAMLMGSIIEITAYGGDLEPAISEVLAEGERISKMLDYHNPQSDLAQINRLAGVSAVKTVPEIIKLLLRANQVLPDSRALNDAIEIDAERQMVGLKHKDLRLNLDSVARGYLADKMRSILIKHKVKGALINAQSNMVAIGKSRDNKNWRVGIRHPHKAGEIIGIITLKPGEALSMMDEKRYSRIIDTAVVPPIPSSAGPASGPGLQSAALIGKSAFECDILAAAVFVLGPVEGMKYIESQKNLSGLLVDSSGSILTSSRIIFESASPLKKIP
jgi:thiamine biosynthesis lipoprotein